MLLPTSILGMSCAIIVSVETRKMVGRTNRRCWLRVVLLDSKVQHF